MRGVNGIIVGVQAMERAREGVAVLMNYEEHIAVIAYGCISSRILWVKSKFSRVKVYAVMYGPLNGKLNEMKGSGTT